MTQENTQLNYKRELVMRNKTTSDKINVRYTFPFVVEMHVAVCCLKLSEVDFLKIDLYEDIYTCTYRGI